ncbi:MAG: hypothetical protein E6657_12955, partial [Acinetobacter sp.]|nr:hypothetical protein [Acinetobacter sp.]
NGGHQHAVSLHLVAGLHHPHCRCRAPAQVVIVTTAIETGDLFKKIGLPRFNRETDRAMLCGSPAFLKDVAALLDQHGLVESPRMGEMGDYVIERAFVEK